jgi:DNA-binding ferritin-like protein
MSCQKKLQYLIHDNFLAYHQAHIDHFNITGPNFPQYHQLLKEVYDVLYTWFDTLGEQLRTMGEKVDHTIELNKNNIITAHNGKFDEKAILIRTVDNLTALIDQGNRLCIEAGKEADCALQTVVSDYLVVINKMKWMVESCQTNR